MNNPSSLSSQSSFHTAFPGFNPPILERLSHHGIEEIFEASTLLFVRGARNVDMFVVLDGEIEVFENTGQGQGNVVAILTDGQFTGELDLLDSRQTLLDCRAIRRSRVLRVNRLSLQQIMRSDTEIADIILRASIGRRFDIVRLSSGGAVLIGHEHSADTIRLQRFLTRNGYPFRLGCGD